MPSPVYPFLTKPRRQPRDPRRHPPPLVFTGSLHTRRRLSRRSPKRTSARPRRAPRRSAILATGAHSKHAHGSIYRGSSGHQQTDPALFLPKASDVLAGQCPVIEDAPSGIQAARAGGMAVPGVAGLGDEVFLREASANLAVTSLDQVDARAIPGGTLHIKPTTRASVHG